MVKLIDSRQCGGRIGWTMLGIPILVVAWVVPIVGWIFALLGGLGAVTGGLRQQVGSADTVERSA
jgi:uncharacterized membrane protein